MKKIITLLEYLLLIIFLVGLVVLGSKTIRNMIFYSTKFLSREVFSLNDKINSISPTDTSLQRVELLKKVDNFVTESVSGKGFSTKVYSLIRVRLDQALKEIPNTQVPKGKVKIWYLYNMGVIAKSEDKTIAFDLASTYAYPNMADFTKFIDILLITHPHNDHFDLPVLREALKNNVTVIIPGDKVVVEGDQIVRNPNGESLLNLIKKRQKINSDNFISIKPQEKTTIKGVEITAYPAYHGNNQNAETDIGVSQTPVNWYLVKLGNLTLLHTGDGGYFNYQTDFSSKNVDVFMTHNNDPVTNESLIKLVPNAKNILPLHIWELGHGSDIVNYMTYKNALDDYSNGYFKTLPGKTRFIPMIWGESLFF